MSKGAKLSLLLISLTVLLMAALMSGVIKSNHWEVSKIKLSAEFKRVNSEQIRIAVASYPERSFFKINADLIRENLINIPWVQHVSVNKKWPDTLIITLIEHKAVAVWNNDKLLNAKGEIFQVDSIDDLTTLPQFIGKNSRSIEIWEKYIRYNDIVRQTGYDINSVTVTDRGGWNLNLSNGMKINMGSKKIDAKLVRLADTWVKLIQLKDQAPEYIDLRYTNGYVAKWQETNNLEIDTNSTNQPPIGNING